MEEGTLRCPACGSTALQPSPGETLTCSRCGAVSAVDEPSCPACGATNPPTARFCASCGRTLDLVGHILQTRLVTQTDRLDRIQRQAVTLKEQSEAASEERMRQMWAQEEERRLALAKAKMAQKEQERKFLIAAIIFAAVVVVGLIIFTLVTSGGLGTPTVTPSPF